MQYQIKFHSIFFKFITSLLPTSIQSILLLSIALHELFSIISKSKYNNSINMKKEIISRTNHLIISISTHGTWEFLAKHFISKKPLPTSVLFYQLQPPNNSLKIVNYIERKCNFPSIYAVTKPLSFLLTLYPNRYSKFNN